MKFRNLILAFSIVVGLSAELPMKASIISDVRNTTAITQKDKYSVHIVQKGQTIYAISVLYKTSVEEIYKLNPSAREGIKYGDIIRLPKPKIKGYTDHQIEVKETLYGISKLYSLKTDDLINANPGLTTETFKVGRKIKIPVFDLTSPKTQQRDKMDHKVEKGETIYSISRTYNVSVESLKASNPQLEEKGLKVGKKLLIPIEEIQLVPENTETITPMPVVRNDDPVFRIGILLPFTGEKESTSADKANTIPTDKIAEYYDGFLLAVKEVKEQKMNLEIFTFDIGADASPQRLETLLGTSELKSLNLLLGGVSKKQIATISNFSKQNKIKYIIPFGGQTDELKTNPYSFQVVNSHSNLFGKVYKKFESLYKNYNIIFIEELSNDNNKVDFATGLKKKLTASNIAFKTIKPGSSLTSEIGKVMDANKKNVIVPTSSSEIALKRIVSVLRIADNKVQPSLFGYPEWQTYNDMIASFELYDTVIYSSFFFNENDGDSKNFNDQYKKWYSSYMIPSYPKYGCMGYDTGLFFLSTLHKFGVDFDSKLALMKANTLQSALSFERNNAQSGYVNTGLYFINFKKGGEIQKTDCNK